MGCLALEFESLGAIDGHGVPLRHVVDARALFAGPVGTRLLEGVGVESGGTVGNWLDYLYVGEGDLSKR